VKSRKKLIAQENLKKKITIKITREKIKIKNKLNDNPKLLFGRLN
jgi:hypothetical protein